MSNIMRIADAAHCFLKPGTASLCCRSTGDRLRVDRFKGLRFFMGERKAKNPPV